MCSSCERGGGSRGQQSGMLHMDWLALALGVACQGLPSTVVRDIESIRLFLGGDHSADSWQNHKYILFARQQRNAMRCMQHMFSHSAYM
eukprot:scaffold279359_cov27-Prasinocladus_malaysianus.AAC.1